MEPTLRISGFVRADNVGSGGKYLRNVGFGEKCRRKVGSGGKYRTAPQPAWHGSGG
jgi:hypothetical protein